MSLGCYSYNNFKNDGVLEYYKIRGKSVPIKILNNLKYYFYARTDGSFDLKVVFKENSGINIFVRFPTLLKCFKKCLQDRYTD